MAAPMECPFCSSSMMAEPGQTVQCPACGASFVAQAGASAPPPPSALPPVGDVSCPMCGELIKANARVCRFCKAQLGGAPHPAPPPPSYPYGGTAQPPYGYSQNPPPKKKSSCLLWVILAIVGAVVLVCGGGVVLWLVGKEAGAKAMCKANLEQQLAPQIRNETAGGKVDPELDRLRGEKFWKEIARRRGQPDQFICFGAALKGEQRGLLGPQKPLSEIRDDEPVGCCPRGTHKEGIWIIYKTGKIEFVDSDSPAAKKAFEALGD